MALGDTIETTQVKAYGSSVYHLAQQKDSKLRNLVMFETFVGEGKFYDRLGTTDVYEKTGRYSDTQWQDVEWTRRRLNFRDYRWAHPVDSADKLRMIISPESELSKAARSAFGRKIDEIIVTAALGTSYAGKEGTVPVALPNSQKIGATDGTAFSKLNVETLRIVRQLFWDNEAISTEDEEINLVCTGSDLMNMLRETEVTSSDYNTIKALVNGEINTFMGFRFHRLNNDLIPNLTTSVTTFDPTTGAIEGGGSTIPVGSNRCFAFVKEGLRFAMNEDVMSRVDERPDKDYITQLYMKMAMGGMRMEEVKVVEILTKQ